MATRSRLSGAGGSVIFVGAVAYIVHLVARSVLTAGVDPVVSAQAPLWIPINLLGAFAAVLVLLGLPVVAARMAARGGSAQQIGFALIAASWMFLGVFLSLYGALVLPWLAGQAPRLVAGSSPAPMAFVVAFAVALLAWLVGAVLLAIPFLKGSQRPRWIGYALPVSALWAMAGTFVIAPSGPAGNLAVNLLSNLGPALLLIGFARLGAQAWAERNSAGIAERRARHASQPAASTPTGR